MSTNRGQLIADATCAPADIRYPTDISLLNEAREKTEEVIDPLHAPLVGKTPRPRTYRQKARRCFVAFTKHKSLVARRFAALGDSNYASCVAISGRLIGCSIRIQAINP